MARLCLYSAFCGRARFVQTMAERISKEVKIKAASKALTSQLVDLIGVIDPLMMAANLISKDIIDQAILEKVRLPSSTNNEKAWDVLINCCLWCYKD